MIPRRLNSLFDSDDFFAPISIQHKQMDGTIDVKEDDKTYSVFVDLPGYSKENLNVEVNEANMVHISAKRETEEAKEGEKYILRERSSQEFTRAFTLPKEVDRENVDASYENGVLKLVIPKIEKKVAQSVKVQFK